MEPTTTAVAAATVSPVGLFVGGIALGAGVYTGYRLAIAVEDHGLALAQKATSRVKGMFKKKDQAESDSEDARAARAARAFEAAH